jgi:hypothetical protein
MAEKIFISNTYNGINKEINEKVPLPGPFFRSVIKAGNNDHG